MKYIGSKEPDLSPIWITVYYDSKLQLITGMPEERIMINQGCPFIFILQSIFMSYKEIQKKYPPGILGFTLNGEPPNPGTLLNEGDSVCLAVYAAEK